MNEPQGAYLAVLQVLKGLAKAGVIDSQAMSSVGFELARKGNALMKEGFQVEGAELLRLADASAEIHNSPTKD